MRVCLLKKPRYNGAVTIEVRRIWHKNYLLIHWSLIKVLDPLSSTFATSALNTGFMITVPFLIERINPLLVSIVLVPMLHPTCDPVVGNNSWVLVICGSPNFTCEVVCLSSPFACHQSFVHCPYIKNVGDMTTYSALFEMCSNLCRDRGYMMQNKGSDTSMKLQI